MESERVESPGHRGSEIVLGWAWYLGTSAPLSSQGHVTLESQCLPLMMSNMRHPAQGWRKTSNNVQTILDYPESDGQLWGSQRCEEVSEQGQGPARK